MEATQNVQQREPGPGSADGKPAGSPAGNPAGRPGGASSVPPGATPGGTPGGSASGPVANEPKAPKRRSTRRFVMLGILLVAAIVGGIYVYRMIQFNSTHADTDDAQVDGHISPVLSRVAGYVAKVDVEDNSRVKDGQVVVQIDPKEFQVKLANAEALLASAQAAVTTAQAGLNNAHAALAVAQANVATAQVSRDKTAADLERDRNLVSGGAITKQQFEATRAAAEAAASQLETSRRQVQVAEAQVKMAESQVASARTQVSQRSSDVELARLQLDYTGVAAPSAGVVSKKNVEVGQFVQAGQPLMAIAEDDQVWVTANFKETQLTDVRSGEPVEISVDGYPDVVFHGHVESVAGATGAKFALLPPDNATGNFVKVTQRIPVKIILDKGEADRHKLRPGMSAEVVIETAASTR